MVDQEDLIPALREGIKYLRLGELVYFSFLPTFVSATKAMEENWYQSTLRFTIELLKHEKTKLINDENKQFAVLFFVDNRVEKFPELDEGLYANIETNKGDIILQLELEKTPITVANFVSLQRETTLKYQKVFGKEIL